MTERNRAPTAARVFIEQPDRIARAWRQARFAQGEKGDVPDNLLDGVVEPFVQQIGQTLIGAPGSAWSRTRGVLRLSHERGARALFDELGTLRRCLFDAIVALGGSANDRRVVARCLDEALASALTSYGKLIEPSTEAPEVPFGGLVVECYERRRRLHVVGNPEAEAVVH